MSIYAFADTTIKTLERDQFTILKNMHMEIEPLVNNRVCF